MSIQLQVNKASGGSGGEVVLSDGAFGKDFNEPLVHQVVVAYQAGGRAGTRAQKSRAAVRGGGSKPWRQKGTGRARAGTIRSPLFRGGGVTFPATTKNYSQKVNRTMYRAAMRSILSELHRQGRLVAVEGLTMEKPSTRGLLEVMRTLGVGPGCREIGSGETDAGETGAGPRKGPQPKVLIILAQPDSAVELSARNLLTVSVCLGGQINPLALVRHDHVVVAVEALRGIDEVLK